MLQVRQLGFRYPGAAADALVDVSLEAQRGAVLGLLGPNGAGKSTLIAHLAGALLPLRGEIRVDGLPLAALRASDPTRIAIAPQDFAFYPALSVRQNLACFAAAARVPRERHAARVSACAATARLEPHLDTRADQLSGGLKRRLNLAIALLAEPQLLVLDEPTVGVDPQTRAFVLEAVRSLAQAGAALIVSSHHMEEIEAVADRVLVIDHGRCLREGTLAALLDGGAPALTLAAEGTGAAALCALLAPFGEVQPLPPGERVRLLPAAGAGLAPVFAALQAAGVVVRHAEYGRQDLGQLFMALTQRSLRE